MQQVNLFVFLASALTLASVQASDVSLGQAINHLNGIQEKRARSLNYHYALINQSLTPWQQAQHKKREEQIKEEQAQRPCQGVAFPLEAEFIAECETTKKALENPQNTTQVFQKKVIQTLTDRYDQQLKAARTKVKKAKEQQHMQSRRHWHSLPFGSEQATTTLQAMKNAGQIALLDPLTLEQHHQGQSQPIEGQPKRIMVQKSKNSMFYAVAKTSEKFSGLESQRQEQNTEMPKPDFNEDDINENHLALNASDANSFSFFLQSSNKEEDQEKEEKIFILP